MTKGDYIFYARIMPKMGLFEVEELIVRSIGDTWFTALNSKTKQSFLFSFSQEEKDYFFTRSPALEKVKLAQSTYGTVKLTKIKEEED